MKYPVNTLHRRYWLVSAVLALGVSLLWVQTAFAPPKPAGGPKKPAAGPAHKAGQPGPGPKKPPHGAPGNVHRPGGPGAKPPLGKARPTPRKYPHRHYVRRLNYWQPFSVRRPSAPAVYTSLGYPYYVGGTNYVFAPSGDSGQSDTPSGETVILPPSSESSEAMVSVEGPVDDPYVQMLELIDMTHEWRTMNESPAVHERLSSAQASGEAGDVISSIHDDNLQFDQLTRDAMRKLSGGHSAAMELSSARDYLEELIELMDKLPEVKNEGEMLG